MKTFGWGSQETQHSRTEISWADGSGRLQQGIKECNLMSRCSGPFNPVKTTHAFILSKPEWGNHHDRSDLRYTHIKRHLSFLPSVTSVENAICEVFSSIYLSRAIYCAPQLLLGKVRFDRKWADIISVATHRSSLACFDPHLWQHLIKLS